MRRIRHGGSFFLGHEAAEAFRRLHCRTNTSCRQVARRVSQAGFRSMTFYRRQTFLQLHDLDEQITKAAIRIARQEQLEGHARAMAVRLEDV